MAIRKRVPKPDCEPCISGESLPIEQSGIVIDIDKLSGDAYHAALNSALKALTDDLKILSAAIHAPGLPSWDVFQSKAVFWYGRIAEEAGFISHYEGRYIEYLKSVDEANGRRPKEYGDDWFGLQSKLWNIQDAAIELLAKVGLHFGINCESLFQSAAALRAFIKQLPTPAILFASVTQCHENVIQRARIGREESVSRLITLDASAAYTIWQLEQTFRKTEKELHKVETQVTDTHALPSTSVGNQINYGYLDIAINVEHRIVSRKNHKNKSARLSDDEWPLFLAMLKAGARGISPDEALNSCPEVKRETLRQIKRRLKLELEWIWVTIPDREWVLTDKHAP